ncbi:MAG: NADH-quinone oxidoreductase subunit C [Bacteroidetes bacterium]|nr:NADH-quinone oxidoreductase subunit C [Bacteroidota bacterium]MBK6839764.1 NADH-quinone oxidoreductase subunit C [Bacteroidota bacterium]MBK9525832.1 NADH-quinone oxidoreductase subunit C [Bacteroidota bacterium]MBK9543251.1 NADH-quinone oxidoreductase subunit C [Bacteroidota bacterium]MBP6402612.1 NADH-quinone oxidoreductase subunit C [Bacteroidia bacterium]
MTKEELKESILNQYPESVFEETGEWLTLQVEPEAFLSMAMEFRSRDAWDFDYLFCLTCVDWKTHFTMVYFLRSLTHRHMLTIKVKLDRNNPEIETVNEIWRTADFNEREVYDLFGVKFLHHHDLRRILLTDDWIGWPLRKDYDDPVNMIKL